MLMDFCKTFEQLYGKQYYTINMHLHAHLMDCIVDYGPVYAFWLFSYERLNGVLGSYHTNCHDISLQLMRRFASSTYYSVENWPSEYKDELYPLLNKHEYIKGSLEASSLEEMLETFDLEDVRPLPPVFEVAWESHQKSALYQLAASSVGHSNFEILMLYDKATAISVGKFVLGSSASRFVTKSHVMAIHPNQSYLAKIEYFAKINIKIKMSLLAIYLVLTQSGLLV